MVGGGATTIEGTLLGDDSGLPRALADDFRGTGMTYIIAISGQTEALVTDSIDPVVLLT